MSAFALFVCVSVCVCVCVSDVKLKDDQRQVQLFMNAPIWQRKILVAAVVVYV